jgi:chemotaxis protein MotB
VANEGGAPPKPVGPTPTPTPSPAVPPMADARASAELPAAPSPLAAIPTSADISTSAGQALREMEQKIAAALPGRPSPGVEVKQTSEGLLISLTDKLDFSMFAVGSAEPQAKMIEVMAMIAKAIEARPGQIVVRGHTDARPFKSATYDNWRLSSARAQMAYYMLVRAGLPDKRFESVEGEADHKPKDPAHPLAAENRRIEILVRESAP